MTLHIGIPVYLLNDDSRSLKERPIGFMKSRVLEVGLKRSPNQTVYCGEHGSLDLILRSLTQNSPRGQQTIAGFVVTKEERKMLKECLSYCSIRSVDA